MRVVSVLEGKRVIPEEINRRIAVLCGWKSEAKNPAEAVMTWVRPGNEVWNTEKIPDYRHSLDACAEFETQALMTSRMVEYYRMICKVIGSDDGINAFVAGPSTRCEAFLRMHNQWEGE